MLVLASTVFDWPSQPYKDGNSPQISLPVPTRSNLHDSLFSVSWTRWSPHSYGLTNPHALKNLSYNSPKSQAAWRYLILSNITGHATLTSYASGLTTGLKCVLHGPEWNNCHQNSPSSLSLLHNFP